MSYKVLARKWRPRTFTEMVGQEHVLRALVNALDHNRLHHAYLFTGTRGVGKTTIARILAKSLNCENGMGSTPCGKCAACTEIDEGRFVDLIEVDAASRTKVEDTRELLDNVQYAPTRGRFKIYLVDEVHMLSKHSFNALLKTLEEPPPHVKFLLATTDPQKLPVTILSRCLQFNMKSLSLQSIAGHLGYVLGEESVPADTAAVRELARAANGSMRDALSLLDQAIAYGGGEVLEADVRAMLGTIEQGYVYTLLQAIADADGAKALEEIARLAEQAPDFEGLLAEILSVLQRIAIAQMLPDGIDDSEGDREVVLALAGAMKPEDVQLYYQIGLIGRRDLPLAPDPRGGLEMVLLRMLAFRPAAASQPGAVSGGTSAVPNRMRDDKPDAGPAAAVTAQISKPTTARSLPGEEWGTVVPELRLTGMLREFALNCALQGTDDQVLHLTLAPSHKHLRSPSREKQLEAALQEYYGKPVHIKVDCTGTDRRTPAQELEQQRQDRQVEAVNAISNDENIKALQEAFGGQVHEGSVRPRDT